MDMKERLKALFMSKEQIIYLIVDFFCLIIYGMLTPTFMQLDIGLGSRYYSVQLIASCVIGCVYAYIATDLKKKRWVLIHFKEIDLCETLFFSTFEIAFLIIYIVGHYNPTSNWVRVCKLFFFHDFILKIVRMIVQTILPSIGDVFEQSLYKNQIDYQNHSNAERLVCNFGAVIGATLAFAVGDFFKDRPYLIFTIVVLDWLSLWSRWQFYFKPSNWVIIKANFAKDYIKWKKEHQGKISGNLK